MEDAAGRSQDLPETPRQHPLMAGNMWRARLDDISRSEPTTDPQMGERRRWGQCEVHVRVEVLCSERLVECGLVLDEQSCRLLKAAPLSREAAPLWRRVVSGRFETCLCLGCVVLLVVVSMESCWFSVGLQLLAGPVRRHFTF